MIDRRSLLATSIAGTGLLGMPRLAFARAEGDRRFVFIMQRGAADGLATLAPVGDPAFAALRGRFAADAESGAKIDPHFALHPTLSELAGLYRDRQALFVHAIASPYRDRSHFDGQNILETGGDRAYALKDGWINRLIGLLPAERAKAMAIAVTIPPAMRGPHPVSSYAPSRLPDASEDFLARVAMLYSADAQLGALWDRALETREMAGEQAGRARDDGAELGKLVARLMAPANGARVAMVETGGWDTHANQRGILARRLADLDAMIAAIRDGLGAAWSDTAVLVATEFGRTAAPNGTGGTDHGTAALAMLVGGAVKGGRVIADWPGLAPGDLYHGRDLRPTASFGGLAAGLVAEQFGLDPARAMAELFPGSSGRAMTGLVRA